MNSQRVNPIWGRWPAGRARRLTVGILCGLVAGLALSTSASARPAVPQPGPGGTTNGKIAFTSDRGGSKQIYVMNADGSGQTQLTSGLDAADSSSWSPDGSKIAFMGTTAATNTQLYVMNADGSGQRRLTSVGSLSNADAPAWSPNGQQLTYVTFVIFVLNIDGSGPHRLTSWSGAQQGPHWSPNGKRVVFNGLSPSPERKFGIFVTDVAGTGDVTRLTTSPDASPSWFPGGGRIAFNKASLGLGMDIYVMNADGSAPTNVTNSPKSESDVALSPDGLRFVFHGNAVSVNNLDIYAINADATGLTRLTTHDASDIRPSWQPVNRRLDAEILEGTPPTILCGPGDRAWQAGDARIVCKPGTRLPLDRALAASG